MTKETQDNCILVEDHVFNAMVNYVLAHQDDIELSINDFGDLKIVLDWFSRNVKNDDHIYVLGDTSTESEGQPFIRVP